MSAVPNEVGNGIANSLTERIRAATREVERPLLHHAHNGFGAIAGEGIIDGERNAAPGVLDIADLLALHVERGDDGNHAVAGELLAIAQHDRVGKDTSTEELLIEQMMRNEGKRFSEYECGIMFKRFKEEFGYTQNEIAEKFKKSPAFVSKCLSLMDLPIEIQERIINKQISASAAKDIVANYDTEEEQVNATRKAVELAEKQGKRTVTNKEINAVQKEAKEAKEIAQALRKVWAYLDGGVMVDVDKLAILLDKTESLSNAMKQYKKLSK